METNKGRIVAVGPNFIQTLYSESWAYIFSYEYGPRGRPTPILFNIAPRSASFWVMWNSPPEEQIVCKELFDYPGQMGWYHSDAVLEDVVEITPCLLDTGRTHAQLPTALLSKGQTPVIGLLLRYVDGSRASVGEFRLDWASSPLIVGTSERLYLDFPAGRKGCFRVAQVQLSPPPEADSAYDWMEVPWEGRLVWEFTRDDCVVTHETSADWH